MGAVAAREVMELLVGLVSTDGVRARGRKERLEDVRSVVMLMGRDDVRERLAWEEVAALAVEAVETECRDAVKKSKAKPRQEFARLLRTVGHGVE